MEPTPPTPREGPGPATAGRPASAAVRVERGTAYVYFAHDIGLSVDLDKAEQRITSTKQRGTIKHKRRAPRYFEYDPPPLRLTQGVVPLLLGGFPTTDTVEVMIYDFGAASVMYTIPLAGPLDRLLALSDELYDNAQLLADSRGRVEQILAMIAPAVNKANIADVVEDYAVYQIESFSPPAPAAEVFADHRRLLAQVLRAEVEPLSDQEADEALSSRLSFRGDDLLIIDWNAALLMDTDADDVRAVLEYANVELVEMRYLDHQLDQALAASYEALVRRGWRPRLLAGSRPDDLRRVAELRVDGALLFEGVNNALKLFGDQYLARVYRLASEKFHSNDWDTVILRKLQTMESIYEKIADRHANRRMEILEWIIIILIALSILVPFLPGLTGH